MFELVAFALLQFATLVGSPKTAQTAPKTATQTSFATSTTTAPAPTPTSTIGNTGWDNDITAH